MNDLIKIGAIYVVSATPPAMPVLDVLLRELEVSKDLLKLMLDVLRVRYPDNFKGNPQKAAIVDLLLSVEEFLR